MSVKKFKPLTPHTLEDEGARRIARSRRLIEETKKTVQKTRFLLEQSRQLIKRGATI